MAQGRDKPEWGRAAAIMALLANINRDQKKKPRPYESSDFDPYHEKDKDVLPGDITDLKCFLKDGGKGSKQERKKK